MTSTKWDMAIARATQPARRRRLDLSIERLLMADAKDKLRTLVARLRKRKIKPGVRREIGDALVLLKLAEFAL